MQTTFFVEMGFQVEVLMARYYKDYMSKKMLDRIGMTLQSLKTYRYIGSKTKNYQIKRISSIIYLLTLQTLAFRPHTFRLFPSLTKTQFAQALDPRSHLNNLNRIPFAESLTSHSMLKPSSSTKATNFSYYCITATGVKWSTYDRKHQVAPAGGGCSA